VLYRILLRSQTKFEIICEYKYIKSFKKILKKDAFTS